MSNSKINAERIHQAFQGKNKEETILDIVITNDLNQRLEIANTYEELYKTSLYEDIKSKLKGDFKELSGYLFLSPQEFSAKMLKRGFKGFSIDEEIIFEILSAHTFEELLNETKEIIEKNDDIVNISTAKIQTEEYLESILNKEIIIENNI